MPKLPRPADLRKLTATQRVTAGIAGAVVVTIILWLTGLVDSAATLTAYATLLLASGTIGLAWGAIGTYVEQRRQGLEQQRQIAAQQHQLEIARENDIAQVAVKRLSGPGEFLKISVTNNSSRAIRAVYVWADVDGMRPHYEAIVEDTDPQTGQARTSRRMRVFRITVGDDELYRCYRAMLPGETETFVQFTHTVAQAVPDVDNAWITAYALFSDITGTWWKCSQDGELERLPEAPTLVTENRPVMGTGVPSTRPVPGVARFAVHHEQQAGEPEQQPPAG